MAFHSRPHHDLARSRALKTLNQSQLAAANAIIQKRLAERKNGLEEACTALPSDPSRERCHSSDGQLRRLHQRSLCR